MWQRRKLIWTVLILFFFLSFAHSLRFPKIRRAIGITHKSSAHRMKMSVRLYSFIRRSMMYFWGRKQIDGMEKSLLKHAVDYGGYYLTLYNFIYLIFFVKKYLEDLQHKEQRVENMVSNYKSALPSTAGEAQGSSLNGIEDLLKQSIWMFQQRTYSSLEVLQTEIHFIRVVQTAQSIYKIVMVGYDRLGKSEITGILTIIGQKMEIMMMKQYDDYCQFVSSDKWIETEYVGRSGDDFEWNGTWNICDEQDSKDPSNSGVWVMWRRLSQLC